MILWLGKADLAHQATHPLDGWSPGGLRGPWGCGWREAGRLLPAGSMPVCRGLHSQLTRIRCIRGLVPALWGSPEGE